MRVAVIGAGAMGSLVSLPLCNAGMEVVVYERREERATAIKSEGIRVRGAARGEAFPAMGRAGEPVAPYDVVVLAVNAAATGDALRPLSPFVHRDTVYLSLQEGDAVSGLAGLVGGERAFAVSAWVSASLDLGGEVEVEGLGPLVFGAFLPGREEAIGPLVEAAEAAFPGAVRLTSDLGGAIWKRLEAAAGVSALCAIAGAAPREARMMEVMDRLCGEAAAECRLTAASGSHGPAASGSAWDDAVWNRIKPPMLADIEAGGMTEIGYMSGSIVRHARAAGIAAPVHGAMLTVVREMESGRHRPGAAACRELERRIGEEKGMSLL